MFVFLFTQNIAIYVFISLIFKIPFFLEKILIIYKFSLFYGLHYLALAGGLEQL